MPRIRTAEGRNPVAKRRRIFQLLAATGAALLLSSCFGGGSGSAAGAVVAYNTKLNSPLNPYGNDELAGSRPLDLLFSGLMSFGVDGTPQLELASDVKLDPSNNKLWHITLRQDGRFSNGEKVTAKSFADAWNFAAKKSSGMVNRSYLSNIVGYNEDGDDALSGVKVVDDYNFEVTLKTPDVNFKTILGSYVMTPLPPEAYKDIEAFGRKPIGNGPYKLASWTPGVEMVLEKNPEYKGPRTAKNEGVKFTVYSQRGAAYRDLLSGDIDVLDAVPEEDLSKFKQDLPDRYSESPVAGNFYLSIPSDAPGFAFDNEGRLRRAAISRAIDRQAISDNIFKGTRKPAKEFTAPNVPGYSATIPGHEVLSFDAAEAKKLWEQANAIKPWAGGTLTINYATDRGDKETFEALAHSIKNALGVNVEPAANLDWPANKEAGLSKKQPMRVSWNADVPTAPNFLYTLFGLDSPSNYASYTDAQFNQLLKEGDESADLQASIIKYRQAQERLMKDLPMIPLVYAQGLTVWSEKIQGPVKNGWNGPPAYWSIAKK